MSQSSNNTCSTRKLFVPLTYYHYDGPILLIEAMLIMGVVWLVFKKSRDSNKLDLTESEEEDIIRAYTPDRLVHDTSEHPALKPRVLSGKVGLFVNVNGMDCVNFSSHDYFGFISNAEVEDKVLSTVDKYGVGSCGPRGFYGTVEEHLTLEKLIADTLGMEDAMVYSCGFITAASAIPAYAKKADIIFADEEVNAAIRKGLEASRSVIKFFKHNNVNSLENVLDSVRKEDIRNPRKARRSRRYLVVEGIYYDTGEICPLPDLVKLCKKYKLRIFLDESISFGVLGETGKGVTEYFGVSRADVDLIIGSLEHSLASVGGFSAGSRFLIDHQQISGQGYCFSASLPPLLVAAALASLRVIQEHPRLLTVLKNTCRTLHAGLAVSGLIQRYFHVTGDQDSPVHVLTLRTPLQESHYVIKDIVSWCQMRHIAVTQTSSLSCVKGIRITTCVHHTDHQIASLIQVLEEACQVVLSSILKDV